MDGEGAMGSLLRLKPIRRFGGGEGGKIKYGQNRRKNVRFSTGNDCNTDNIILIIIIENKISIIPVSAVRVQSIFFG